MSPRARRILVISITVLLVGIVLALTFTLPQLQLKYDNQYLLESKETPGVYPFIDPSGATTSSFIRVAFIMLVILGVSIPLLLVWERKGWRRAIITMALLALLLIWLNRLNQRAIDVPETPTGTMIITPGEYAPMSVQQGDISQESFNPDRSEWAVRLMFIGLGLLVAGLAGGLTWLFFTSRQRGEINLDLERLSGQVDEALQALQDGEDVSETIQRCYLNMSALLAETRHLERQEAMTPAEFARALKGHNLPEDAVDDLTHLFELVRYGNIYAEETEQQHAIQCLQTIKMALAEQLDGASSQTTTAGGGGNG